MTSRPCRRCSGTGREPDWTAHGARMRKRRERMGKSLREVGDATDCSAMYISDLENGKRAWRGPKAQRVAAYLTHSPKED